MGWKYDSPGGCESCSCGEGTPPPGTCTTYAVQVLDTSGGPVPGIAVTLQRRTGVTTTPGSGTLDPVSGSTDSDGRFEYALGPDEAINAGKATIPMGGPAVTNTSATAVGSACTYLFRLCHASNVTTTVDGETGAPVAGATLSGGNCGSPTYGGNLSGENCAPPSGGYPAWWEASGATHTRHAYRMTPIGSTGAPGTPVNHGHTGGGSAPGPTNFIMGGGVSCKEGYWGDAGPAVATPCGTQSTSTVPLWRKDKYLLNPNGQARGGRETVLAKSMCVSLAAPKAVVGATQYIVPWDPTSWDGDPCRPNGKGIAFRGCFPAGDAVGSCACSAYDEAVDYPYGSVLVEAAFLRIAGGWTLQLSIRPIFGSGCIPDDLSDNPCGCPGGGPFGALGGHLECRVPLGDGSGREVYTFRMPAQLDALAGAWSGSGGTSVDVFGLYSQSAALTAGGISQFWWGCDPDARQFATAHVSDGECGDTYGPYDPPGGDDDDDMEILDPGPMVLGFEEDDVLVDLDGHAFAAE